MTRLLAIGGLVLMFTLLAACNKFQLPDEKEMMAVFTTDMREELIEPPAPESIPVLAVSELQDWHELCDQCHVGPNYSSHTILNWGHLESCVSSMACTECHAPELHRTDVRGNKGQCYDCHLRESVPTKCETCHPPGCRSAYAAHDAEFLGTHGKQPDWQGMDCMHCHGSKSWCMACHGIEMPHPEDYITTHPQLVQGEPEVCNNCHGSQSCLRCHEALGIKIVQQ